jgi:hypothetical protein
MVLGTTYGQMSMRINIAVTHIAALTLIVCLTGCASSGVHSTDLSKLGDKPTIEDVTKIAHGTPYYRLDYLMGDQTFIYEMYEDSDSNRYYGMLFQGGQLIAVNLLDQHQAYRSPMFKCTLFPPTPGMDVEDCFRKFNAAVQANALELRSAAAPTDNHAGVSGQNGEAVGAVAEAVVLSPILIPAAVVGLPFLGAEKVSEQSARESLDVKLAEPYAEIQSRVEQIPERDRSVTNGNGTVFVPSDLTSIPAAAFGVQDGKVIWIDLAPRSLCGGGFMLWNKDCSMGDHGTRP